MRPFSRNFLLSCLTLYRLSQDLANSFPRETFYRRKLFFNTEILHQEGLWTISCVAVALTITFLSTLTYSTPALHSSHHTFTSFQSPITPLRISLQPNIELSSFDVQFVWNGTVNSFLNNDKYKKDSACGSLFPIL